MPAPDKILVVGPSWVGDMVMTQSLCIALKARFPAVVIDVLAPAWCAALTERMPQVRRAIDMPVGHGELKLGVRRRVARELAAEGYDQAILIPNSFKSALIPWLARIPVRTGWRGEMRYGLLNDCRRLDPDACPLMLDRVVALAWPAGEPAMERLPWPRLTLDPADGDAATERLGLRRDRSVIGFCPGAEYGPAKRWPAEHFARLAVQLIEEGYAVWLFGSGKDRPVTEAIVAAVPGALREHCHDLAGRTALLDAVDLLALTDAVVSNDSGLMHVAAAVGRPLVALYGSSSPDFTPPLSPRARIVRRDLPCSPCFQRECPLGHLDCLRLLSPEQVLAELETVQGLPSRRQGERAP